MTVRGRGMATLVLALTMSCAPVAYDLRIENNTGAMLDDTYVSFDHFRSVGGVFGPGSIKWDSGIERPLPDTVYVQWRTPDSTLHRVTLAVPDAVREHLTRNTEIRVAIDSLNHATISRAAH